MKSEKAKKYLDERANVSYDNRLKVTQYDARKAVKLAEEDARERAVRAYCDTVYNVFCDNCTDDCNRRKEFLENYDNVE